jgi:hypothetical protein
MARIHESSLEIESKQRFFNCIKLQYLVITRLTRLRHVCEMFSTCLGTRRCVSAFIVYSEGRLDIETHRYGGSSDT